MSLHHSIKTDALRWAGDPTDLHDEMRCGLSAYGVSTRRRVIGDVARHLGAYGDDALAALRRALDALEAAGDVLAGDGGRIAAAPLFLARLPGDVALLVGGVSTRDVLDVAHDLTLREGPPRRFAWRDDAVDALAARFAGKVISIETWARLDRAPPADDVFLAALDDRAGRAESAGALERLDAFRDDARQRYLPATTTRPHGLGWKEATAPTAPSLVRWRDGRADWSHGWTLPALWPRALRVSRDDATRVRFALDRRHGASIPGTVTEEGDEVTLRLEGRLPAAEFRYLAASARTIEREPRVTAYVLPGSARVDVLATLRDRLGLAPSAR